MNENHEFRIGEKVEFHPSESFFSANCDAWISKYYPKVGTVGTVVGQSVKNIHSIFVQWPEGTTMLDGRWFVRDKDLRKAFDSQTESPFSREFKGFFSPRQDS